MRATVVLLSTLCLVAAVMPAVPASAATSIGSDQQSVAQLEQEIAAQGAKAQSLVLSYNEAQARVDALDAQIAEHAQLVVTDQRAQARATNAIQRLAIQAYMSNRGSDSTFAMFSGRWSVSRMLEEHHYLGTVNAKLNGMVSTLRAATADTQDARRVLQTAQLQAKQTRDELAAAHDASTRAIVSDEEQLSHVKGDLRALLTAANAQQRASHDANEHSLASPARTPASDLAPGPLTTPAPDPPAPTPSPPVSPSPQGSSSGYTNPFRAVSVLSPERIDEGVDYAGFGPVYAMGNGVVLNTVGPGWPGGTFVAYQLTDGPASGLVVYLAEDVAPSVRVGQAVSSSTVIGQMFEGPDGIETGWANGASLPDTMARTFGQFDGSNSSCVRRQLLALPRVRWCSWRCSERPAVGCPARELAAVVTLRR